MTQSSADENSTRPGRLVLIVGPSGAGKDTLLAGAARELSEVPDVSFPRRIVTRPTTSYEVHDHVSEAAFRQLQTSGAFLVTWTAHGLHYAVPVSAAAELARGRTVVCSVSRTVVDLLRRKCAYTLVVEISARPEILAQRLASRAREPEDDRKLRLARSAAVGAVQADRVIVNEADIKTAVRELVLILRPATLAV